MTPGSPVSHAGDPQPSPLALRPTSNCTRPPDRAPWRAVPARTPCSYAATYGLLVVDDHAGVRTALEALVAGTEDLKLVGTATHGQEAIELARRLRPTVIVMDLAMPGIDGVEAIRRICALQPAPAVVVFSGSRERWREARAAGVTHTLLKDEDPQRLLESIRAAAEA